MLLPARTMLVQAYSKIVFLMCLYTILLFPARTKLVQACSKIQFSICFCSIVSFLARTQLGQACSKKHVFPTLFAACCCFPLGHSLFRHAQKLFISLFLEHVGVSGLNKTWSGMLKSFIFRLCFKTCCCLRLGKSLFRHAQSLRFPLFFDACCCFRPEQSLCRHAQKWHVPVFFCLVLFNFWGEQNLFGQAQTYICSAVFNTILLFLSGTKPVHACSIRYITATILAPFRHRFPPGRLKSSICG